MELDRVKRENHHIKAENSHVHELDRRVKHLENENTALEQYNSKVLLEKVTLEGEVEDLKIKAFSTSVSTGNNLSADMNAKLEALMNERNQFEAKVRQAQEVASHLEQELRQKADERAQAVSDYEVRISMLMNEVTILRSQKDGTTLRQSQNLNRFRSENDNLLGEINELKFIKKSLESQLSKAKKDALDLEENIQLRLAEIESLKKGHAQSLEKEHKITTTLKGLLEQKMKEFEVKEGGKTMKDMCFF